MAISNINQLLIRNLEALAATRPLLVNIADDGFIAQYLAQHSVIQLDSYHSNYAEYQATKRIANHRVQSHFAVRIPGKKSTRLSNYSFPQKQSRVWLHFSYAGRVNVGRCYHYHRWRK